VGLFTATRRARSRVAATPCAGCPLSYRRHPPPVPPGEELGVHLATEAPLTHDTRVSGIRFSVKRSGPSTQDTFDRIDIRRPLTPPSPRELWRRSRTPGSPACRPLPRVNEGKWVPTDQELAPRECVRPNLCRPDTNHVDLRLDPSPMGTLRRFSGQQLVPRPAARPRWTSPLGGRYFRRSGGMGPTSCAPSPDALAAARIATTH